MCNTGFADIVLTALAPTGTVERFVWEVKKWTIGDIAARGEALDYVKVMNMNTENESKPPNASLGWDIGGPYNGSISGSDTTYWGGNSGAVMYGKKGTGADAQVETEINNGDIGAGSGFDAGSSKYRDYLASSPKVSTAPPVKSGGGGAGVAVVAQTRSTGWSSNMSPLDALLAQYVVPVMKDAGFKVSRRSYIFTSPKLWRVYVHVAPWNFSNRVGFHVYWGVIPAALWDFRRSLQLRAEPGWGLVYGTVTVPIEFRTQVYFMDLWSFEPESGRDACGSALRSVLESEAIPHWMAMLDKKGLLEVLAQKRAVNRTGPIPPTPPWILAVLDLYDGDPAEVARLVELAYDEEPNRVLVRWLKERFELQIGPA